jgi:hypothetical protein
MTTNTTPAVGDTVNAPAGSVHADRATTGTVLGFLNPPTDVPLVRIAIEEERYPVVVPVASVTVLQ